MSRETLRPAIPISPAPPDPGNCPAVSSFTDRPYISSCRSRSRRSDITVANSWLNLGVHMRPSIRCMAGSSYIVRLITGPKNSLKCAIRVEIRARCIWPRPRGQGNRRTRLFATPAGRRRSGKRHDFPVPAGTSHASAFLSVFRSLTSLRSCVSRFIVTAPTVRAVGNRQFHPARPGHVRFHQFEAFGGQSGYWE